MRRLRPGWLPGLAAGLVIVGFFAPWMDGTQAFELRSFSGLDFARLIRNFEITAGTAEARGQITAAAIAIYLMPALAVNGALLYQLSAFAPSLRRPAGLALLIAGGYVAAMLGLLLFLSAVPVNGLARVVGLPSWGFAVTLAGAFLLAWAGGRETRRAGTKSAA